MQPKRVLIPEQLRKVPREYGFGWIDRRFLHEGYVRHCDPPAPALYLLLTVVADAQGLSFYADGTLARLVSLPVGAIAGARATLIRAGLIAYQAPITPVLSLDPPSPPRTPGVRSVDTVLGDLQRQMAPRSKSNRNALKPNYEACHVER
jgi:hypothetical protein